MYIQTAIFDRIMASRKRKREEAKSARPWKESRDDALKTIREIKADVKAVYVLDKGTSKKEPAVYIRESIHETKEHFFTWTRRGKKRDTIFVNWRFDQSADVWEETARWAHRLCKIYSPSPVSMLTFVDFQLQESQQFLRFRWLIEHISYPGKRKPAFPIEICRKIEQLLIFEAVDADHRVLPFMDVCESTFCWR